MIKRIQSIAPDGCGLFVVGTDKNSIDSRLFGAIPPTAVIGKVVCVFHPTVS